MSDNELRALAKSHGFLYVRLTGNHFQLKQHGGFTIALWPGQGRIVTSQWTQKYGLLNLPKDWTLQDAVEYVAEKLSNVEQPQ